MPKNLMKLEGKIATRNEFTTLDCVFSCELVGGELPSLAVQGQALEDALEAFKGAIKSSYVVPPRQGV